MEGSCLNLRGLRVLVTGGVSGIGGAVTRHLAALGGRVAASYFASAKEAKELSEAFPDAVFPLHAALGGDVDPARTLPVRAADALGGLDAVVNNAGGMVARRPFAEIDDAFIDAVFDLNVRQAVHVTVAALPWLRASPAGSVVFVSSISARTGGSPGSSIYSASKGFLSTLTRALARELAPDGIRVNAIAPGTIATAFHERHSTPEKLAATRAAIPLGRLGTARDCAGAVAFLLSPTESAYITGQVIEINGGQLLA